MTARELGKHIGSHFWLKSIGSTVVISLFFVAYFTVLNHPVFTVYVMPFTGIDDWMPVVPFSVWIYFSLWIYICLPSALMCTRALLGAYLVGATILSGIALFIFFYFPTAVPAWPMDWEQYPAMAFLKSSDASGNACPSLHVGFAVFSACWLQVMLKRLQFGTAWIVFNWIWCLGIVASTMTTRQHVFLDVVFGSALGYMVAALNIRYTSNETLPRTAVLQP